MNQLGDLDCALACAKVFVRMSITQLQATHAPGAQPASRRLASPLAACRLAPRGGQKVLLPLAAEVGGAAAFLPLRRRRGRGEFLVFCKLF